MQFLEQSSYSAMLNIVGTSSGNVQHRGIWCILRYASKTRLYYCYMKAWIRTLRICTFYWPCRKFHPFSFSSRCEVGENGFIPSFLFVAQQRVKWSVWHDVSKQQRTQTSIQYSGGHNSFSPSLWISLKKNVSCMWLHNDILPPLLWSLFMKFVEHRKRWL